MLRARVPMWAAFRVQAPSVRALLPLRPQSVSWDLLYWLAAWTYIAATGPRATIISVSIGHDVAYAGRLCVAPGSMLVIAMSAYVLVLVVMFAAKERR